MAWDETGPKRRRGRAAYRVAPVWDAERVRALRQHLGLTQDAFSTRLGIRQQTVSEWEVGKHAPRGASRTLLTSIAERAGFAYQVVASLDGVDGRDAVGPAGPSDGAPDDLHP